VSTPRRRGVGVVRDDDIVGDLGDVGVEQAHDAHADREAGELRTEERRHGRGRDPGEGVRDMRGTSAAMLAKNVLEVKKYPAAPTAPTAGAASAPRWVRARAKISTISTTWPRAH
jgi:hypothetical protein